MVIISGVPNFRIFTVGYTVRVRKLLLLPFIFMKQLQLTELTVMCLSIWTPKIINFPFVPNGKLISF